jgi:hypothetical protein
MSFRTRELLKQAEPLPKDEFSVNYATREFASDVDAREFFQRLKRRFVDVSQWNERSGLSSYELFDENGDPIGDARIKAKHFVKITLAGSGKSDWVRVLDIFEAEDELVITVQPTYDPTADPPDTGKISHFFTADARNNFCAFRHGNAVHMYVIGLNERQNTGHADGLIEAARNAAVANLGYYLGIQKAEWTKFCTHFLADGDEEK